MKFTIMCYLFVRLLSPEELLPIIPYVYPGELAYAKYYTSYLINEVTNSLFFEL